MGLLDSDAEELKRNKTNENTSGRKVNQSGLGALKGLSKYSNLTAKYRTTGTSEKTPESDIVEQSCGTSSKSVQSPCEPDAENSTIVTENLEVEVSANSVQSQCSEKIILNKNIEDDLIDKSVQSPCIETIDFPIKDEIKESESRCKVGAKSVQETTLHADFESPITQSEGSNDQPIKSVQSQSISELFSDENKYIKSTVSAKSVRTECDSLDLISNTDIELGNFECLDSQCKVRANMVQSQCATIEMPSFIIENIVESKSVQSQCIEANLLPSQDEIEVTESQPKKTIKVRANREQSPCKPGALKSNISSEIEKNKVSAKSVQMECKVSAESLEDLQVSKNLKSKVLAKSLETFEPMESIISISGSQRVIIDFLFQLCLWNNSLITPPITKQQLISETGLVEETALSSIKRLRKKNIIDRYAYKDGKAGWTQYRFSESSYKELLHLREVSAKSVQRMPVEAGRNVSSSQMAKGGGVSNLLPRENKQGLSTLGWFKNLDFSKIYPISPMVVNPAIRNYIEEKLTPELVQDFINRFTSWTTTQGRITSPIGLFCDKLKELAREGDSPVFGCMTEEERQTEAAFAVHVEKAKAEMELIQKARSENQEKFKEAEFEKWYNSSSDAEKLGFAEPSAFAPSGTEAYKRILKAVYLEKMQLE